MKHIHFIGIGGTGLSAIARVLLEKGYTVSGSDQTESPLFKAISQAGARTFLGHDSENIQGADLVLRSSAIPDANPEVRAAQNLGIPVLKRSDFLEELTQDKQTLAVAGSHGKTTTTAMLVWILTQMNLDPSYIVGGVVNQLGRNAAAGQGPHFVIEADEYDYMFLGLRPEGAIITNIEHDHPDCFPTPKSYRKAFKSFIKGVKPGGIVMLCLENPQAQKLKEKLAGGSQMLLGYGFSNESEYVASDITTEDGLPVFTLQHRSGKISFENLGRVSLSVPGWHNVLNATAALGLLHQLGLPFNAASQALSQFTGAGRRFEILGEPGGVVIIDDYGHHPTEIEATLKAAKIRYPSRRLWAVWQPHTYSRTQILEDAFIHALSLAHQALILKIYAAREENPGYSAETIARALPGETGSYCESFQEAIDRLIECVAPGDVVIVFSAGDATQISQALLQNLSLRKPED